MNITREETDHVRTAQIMILSKYIDLTTDQVTHVTPVQTSKDA